MNSRRATDLGGQPLEMRVLAKALQIVVGHKAIGILITAVDGFAQILKCVIGPVGGRSHTREGNQPVLFIPVGETVYDVVNHVTWLANANLAAGHRVSARDGYLRAANYFRTSEFFLHSNHEDPRIYSAYKKSIRAYKLSASPL